MCPPGNQPSSDDNISVISISSETFKTAKIFHTINRNDDHMVFYLTMVAGEDSTKCKIVKLFVDWVSLLWDWSRPGSRSV